MPSVPPVSGRLHRDELVADGPMAPWLPEAVLAAEVLAVLWLGLSNVASTPVAVFGVVTLLVCLAVALARETWRRAATGTGLVLAAAVLAYVAMQDARPGLAPAVLLTAVIAAAAVERGRSPRGAGAVEAELAARVDELARTKDQLLAVVSHEFRTPVTGVMGFARTMSNHFEGLDQETMRLFVRAIEDHSTRLARLVENLVVAADGVDVDPMAACDIHRVITSVVSTVEDGSHDVHVSLRGARWAQIDPDAARRVIANLVDNSLKFADPDTLVRIESRPVAGDLVVDVVNVGPPLPADLRERLYEPFVQADSSDSRRADGLGLGLHVVRQLVEAHGGRIEHAEGGGFVTFRVRLRPAVVTRSVGPAVDAGVSGGARTT